MKKERDVLKSAIDTAHQNIQNRREKNLCVRITFTDGSQQRWNDPIFFKTLAHAAQIKTKRETISIPMSSIQMIETWYDCNGTKSSEPCLG